MPPDQVASHDATETVESLWASPAEALERGAAGEITLLIPTIANLKALARFSSTAELVAAASGPVVLDPGSESRCPT